MTDKSALGPYPATDTCWVCNSPYADLLQMDIVRAEDGHALVTLPFQPQYAQGAGIMHGGVLAGLADTAMAMACKSVLAEGTYFGTTSLTTDFLLPVTQGVVTAIAQVKKRQGRELVAVVRIQREDKQSAVEGRAVFRVSKREPELAFLIPEGPFVP